MSKKKSTYAVSFIPPHSRWILKNLSGIDEKDEIKKIVILDLSHLFFTKNKINTYLLGSEKIKIKTIKIKKWIDLIILCLKIKNKIKKIYGLDLSLRTKIFFGLIAENYKVPYQVGPEPYMYDEKYIKTYESKYSIRKITKKIINHILTIYFPKSQPIEIQTSGKMSKRYYEKKYPKTKVSILDCQKKYDHYFYDSIIQSKIPYICFIDDGYWASADTALYNNSDIRNNREHIKKYKEEIHRCLKNIEKLTGLEIVIALAPKGKANENIYDGYTIAINNLNYVVKCATSCLVHNSSGYFKAIEYNKPVCFIDWIGFEDDKRRKIEFTSKLFNKKPHVMGVVESIELSQLFYIDEKCYKKFIENYL